MVNQGKKDFDRESSTWDEDPGRVKLARDIAEAILKTIHITPDMEALDYGCGTGLLTLLIQPHVRHITGLDSSRGMLDVLDKKIQKCGLGNVTTKRLDLEKEEALEGPYDLITCSMTLHHAQRPDFLIKQLCNGLRPGGYLCIADLDPDKGRFHADNEGVFHFGFEKSLMQSLFAKSGLVHVRDMTAATITKKVGPEGMESFPVFLITGQKPA
jgi:2-polyprenyl-3-methyl-5-hydroxy-6-metoxy-1,4-benzoquinol methylase